MKRKKRGNNKQKSIIIISTFVIVALLISTYIFTEKKFTAPFSNNNKYSVKGIDVSHHNPILDWEKVKEQNIQFAYIKATEGITHDDRNYPYNYKLAKENNIKVGSYHFYSFAISGRDQARHFINIAQCNSGDLWPVIDVEHSPSNPYSKDTTFVTNVIKELTILENELYEYYGVHPIIYTNINCYQLYIEDRFPNNKIWISSISKEPDNQIKNWIIWQYTHKGVISGIVGDIDFNYFRYPFERLNEILLP